MPGVGAPLLTPVVTEGACVIYRAGCQVGPFAFVARWKLVTDGKSPDPYLAEQNSGLSEDDE
jgi:hypothetical protein